MKIDWNGLVVLTRAECLRVLATGQIGRVVVTKPACIAAFARGILPATGSSA